MKTRTELRDLFNDRHEMISDYDNKQTKELWNQYPSLMIERFTLMIGMGNGTCYMTLNERLSRIINIEVEMCTSPEPIVDPLGFSMKTKDYL